MMIIFAVLVTSLMLAFNLPAFYHGARIAAEEGCAAASSETEKVSIRPFMAMTLIGGGALPIWATTHDLMLVLFVLLLGGAAYIDAVTRWVPDLLIFVLSWVALISVLPGNRDIVEVLAGVAVLMLPALSLNVLTFLRKQQPALASGDLYILPAIGAWLTPPAAGLCLAASFIIAAIAGRYVRGVPFITVLYPVFVMVMLCGIL